MAPMSLSSLSGSPRRRPSTVPTFLSSTWTKFTTPGRSVSAQISASTVDDSEGCFGGFTTTALPAISGAARREAANLMRWLNPLKAAAERPQPCLTLQGGLPTVLVAHERCAAIATQRGVHAARLLQLAVWQHRLIGPASPACRRPMGRRRSDQAMPVSYTHL